MEPVYPRAKGSVKNDKSTSSQLQPGQPFNPSRHFSGVFVPDVLVRCRQLNPTAKFLWARPARYSGENGHAYPSVPTLAVELGLSQRQVQRGLSALERERFIRRDLRRTPKGDYTSTVYIFLLHPIFLGALAMRVSERRENATARNGVVVTDVSPRGERDVTTKIKRRLEEKTSSSPSSSFSTITLSQSQSIVDDDQARKEKGELIELIQEATGEAPDKRLIRDIGEALEIRGISLRQYLNDIRPRLGRLKHRARPGFFLNHATAWHDSRLAEIKANGSGQITQSLSRCADCSGTGRTVDAYCTCRMGRDLLVAEKRVARKKEAGTHESSQEIGRA